MHPAVGAACPIKFPGLSGEQLVKNIEKLALYGSLPFLRLPSVITGAVIFNR